LMGRCKETVRRWCCHWLVAALVFQPGFLGYFLLPETRVSFNYQARVFQKSWSCCCIKILVILTIVKLQIGTFQFSTVNMRHEMRVLLGDQRSFVDGPLIFSFNWRIWTDRGVILHIIGVYANFCLFANLIEKELPHEVVLQRYAVVTS